MARLHQLVQCSKYKDRYFRRNIEVSATMALVIGVEILPPGYEIALARMRGGNDPEIDIGEDIEVEWSPQYKGCPFCGQMQTCFCYRCRTHSCISSDGVLVWTCPNPKCGAIGHLRDDTIVRTSR